jgi:hypothetical protein
MIIGGCVPVLWHAAAGGPCEVPRRRARSCWVPTGTSSYVGREGKVAMVDLDFHLVVCRRRGG